MRRIIVALVLLLVLAAPATARATTSITLVQSDPHLGGPATFTLVMPSKYGCSNGICKSHVDLTCSQAGTVVYEDYIGSAAAQTTGFVLGTALGSTWSSGPADCVATLSYVTKEYPYQITLATTTFAVAG